ncbi:MAG: RNA polymerase factor sigma-54 [Chromatiales bacterium]|jgi:RNA polymerase sigma-54 factor|nr:RNA polymerase factor sigma-54 [Chromatiales bacterium]MDX9766397.1 RNA polymerase factor sigma-54 [Ectothiorhodospiraceae bacterium]
MLKPSVQLRLGQSLTMTPQLQQAIRLLQLSTLELQAQIQETLDENPMLEVADEDSMDMDLETETEERFDGPVGELTDTIPAADSLPEDGFEAPGGDLDGTSASGGEDIPDDLPVDTNWDEIYDVAPLSGGGGEYEDRDPFENQSAPAESLRDHLLWQLHLTPLSETDKEIATAIVDSISEDGYLEDDLESIRLGLAEELEVEPDEMEAVLHRIQHLDPPGVGARNLAECLLLQLRQLPPDTEWLEQAVILVREHLDSLAGRDYKKLVKRLNIGEEDLAKVIALIQSLNPRPGSLVSSGAAEYIVPDVFVRKRHGHWQVELNPEIAPRLRINPMYAGLVRRADTSQDNTYLRNHLQEARWFIKSLQSRNETLLRVATAIVEHQRGFLEYGDEAMKPLVLRDIAEQLEMHESTISRVTTQKYMHTPRGIYEFKFFFSSHVGTADGGECSATAIRAMIRKLVAEEPPGKPMSDSRIADILVERGIHVARRTVAKYREAMSIPPSNERKRLA